MENKINEDELEYIRLDVQYTKAMGREMAVGQNMDLYPLNWFSSKDYKQKSSILREAIEKKCLIKDTDQYIATKEGVEINKNDEEER